MQLLFLAFFFNDTATTEIYTLSLHDALPIYRDFVVDAAASLPYIVWDNEGILEKTSFGPTGQTSIQAPLFKTGIANVLTPALSSYRSPLSALLNTPSFHPFLPPPPSTLHNPH